MDAEQTTEKVVIMNDRDKLRLHPAAIKEEAHAPQQPRSESLQQQDVEPESPGEQPEIHDESTAGGETPPWAEDTQDQ